MIKKKICWVTPDWFVDVDMPIIPHLLDEYDITWIIFFPWRNNRFKEKNFDELKNYQNLHIIFFHVKYYKHDPRYYFRNKTFNKLVEKESANADIIYFNMSMGGKKPSKLFLSLPKNKTIVTAHDGSIKSIMSISTADLYQACFPLCKYVNMFSNFQAKLFRENYSGPEVFVIPLALKDFGKPTKELRHDCVSFVSFGTIHAEKNIPFLIEAANQLYEEGEKKFKVSINGQWKIDESSVNLIRHPEVFEIHEGLVDNKDIPDLFSQNTFAIFTYKQMSQSGAIKVAFNYNKPVIVSDLSGFKEEVLEGVNGFFFHSEDMESLKLVMKKCIHMNHEEYDVLLKSTKQYIYEKYSIENIIRKYKKMFNVFQ